MNITPRLVCWYLQMNITVLCTDMLHCVGSCYRPIASFPGLHVQLVSLPLTPSFCRLHCKLQKSGCGGLGTRLGSCIATAPSMYNSNLNFIVHGGLHGNISKFKQLSQHLCVNWGELGEPACMTCSEVKGRH